MKKNIFSHWPSPAQAKEEADRVEQLREERRAVRRLAHEMFLIQSRATQDEQQKLEEQCQLAYERQAWNEAMMHIQLIHHAYGFE
jgi:hypothetical protein